MAAPLTAPPSPSRLPLAVRRDLSRQDDGQPLDIRSADDVLDTLVLTPQSVDQLRAQDVDLAVHNPPAIGDGELLLSELLDQRLELLIGEGAEVRERLQTVFRGSGQAGASISRRAPRGSSSA